MEEHTHIHTPRHLGVGWGMASSELQIPSPETHPEEQAPLCAWRAESSDAGVSHHGFKSLLCYLHSYVALDKIMYPSVSISPSVKWVYLGHCLLGLLRELWTLGQSVFDFTYLYIWWHGELNLGPHAFSG